MIIWIASYPKSGNTWIRSLLSAYLYTENGNFDFNLLSKIHQFPDKKYFKYFTKDFTDIKKISDHWIAAQDRINLLNNNQTTFFKTHSALCTLENNSFTNKNNTKAALYIVRDPRNLITSLSHHFSLSISESYNFIINKNKILSGDEWGGKNFGISTVLGSWSDHYNSWKNIKFAPILIIKYEELLKDPENTFLKVINFLKKFMDIKTDMKKISNTVNSCSFDALSQMEKNQGFKEAAISKKNNNKLNFFFLGKNNRWQNFLDNKLEKNIRTTFSKEMSELEYI